MSWLKKLPNSRAEASGLEWQLLRRMPRILLIGILLPAMVALMEELGALPLPGHGSAADLSLDQWLDAAGAPRRLRR